MFTFITTCYQQSELILMALESIKHQIEHFGQGQTFQLIVTDDGSTDGSREVIAGWLMKNRGLFAKIDTLFRKNNAGICRSCADALALVAGERFMILNGDDLLSPYRLFDFTDRLSEYDIVCTSYLHFTGQGDMIKAYGTYLEMALQKFITGRTLWRAVRLGCPIMGPAVFRKSLITQEVLDFILRFRTVNDRAYFQKILETNKALKVGFINRPIILRRVSQVSLSNPGSATRELHAREIGQLCRVQLEGERSPFFRLLLRWQEKSAAFRASPNRHVRLLRFFSPYFFVMLRLSLCHMFALRRLERELVDRHWQECEAHYREMAARAAEARQKLPETGGGTMEK